MRSNLTLRSSCDSKVNGNRRLEYEHVMYASKHQMPSYKRRLPIRVMGLTYSYVPDILYDSSASLGRLIDLQLNRMKNSVLSRTQIHRYCSWNVRLNKVGLEALVMFPSKLSWHRHFVIKFLSFYAWPIWFLNVFELYGYPSFINGTSVNWNLVIFVTGKRP